jgi:spermidine synthase
MGVLALFFGLGAFSLITQSVLAREVLLLVRGSELAAGAFFACWLLWIGVGAIAGTRLAPRLGNPSRHLRVWVALGVLSPLAQIALVRSGQRLAGVAPGSTVSLAQGALVTLAALMPFALVVGFTFPLGCRLLADGSSRGIGRLWAAEALGALCGGALFAFVLVGRVGHLAIVLAGAALLVAVAAGLPLGPPSSTAPRWRRAGGLALGLVMLAALPRVSRWDEALRREQLLSIAPADEIVAVFDTPYEQVGLTRLAEQLTLYGDGQADATFPDALETQAAACRLLSQLPSGCRVLVAGNATTGLAQELVRALDERAGDACAQVVVVQPDARIVPAILPYLPPEDAALLGKRVRVVVADPRAFVQATREQFDLVALDVRDPTTVYLNRLFTAEFFAEVRRVLAPGGVLAFRLSSASAYVGEDLEGLARPVDAALRLAFPHVVVSSGEESWYYAATQQGVVDARPEVVDARLRALPRAAPHRAAIVLDWEPGRVRRLVERRARGGAAVVNTDDRPSSYFWGTVLWERFSGEERLGPSRLRDVFEALRNGWGARVLWGAAIALAAWIVAGRRLAARARIDAAVTVLVAGGAAMAMNLVLLLRYQSACGALYERLAMMSGLFMLGVALGTALLSAVAPRVRRPEVSVLAVTVALTGLAAALAPLASSAADAAGAAREPAFAALFVAAGTGLGASFPAAAQVLLSQPGGSASGTGGLMDAMDHLGAMVGALVTGSFLVPALGASATLHLVAFASAGMAVLWLARVAWR